ncbi:MAG: hypothetical protein A3H98_06965 [Bacteroidetes bacterium RIFCSPLOWO2_02_FULL_36_8]|nr:MAG: hypothetical protein A3H98_06965 [Bacteroidetes bacterium RIFCSPLOWO2_02_FULL_36_8]OFY70435.1 MAG: hypothetical protein A3G23_09925 [Bacteroidetes bacterium RIFCSPLOWO2_12_FULL_37_12]
MNISIIISGNFQREAKPLLKKFPSLKSELITLKETLLKNPFEGTPIGKNCYKIRLAIKSKGKGKSGGARIITFVIIEILKDSQEEIIVNLASIYDKSEFANIDYKDLKNIITEIKEEVKKLKSK